MIDGWRGHLKMATHVGLGWGYFVDPGISVNKGQILTLFFDKAGVMREVTTIFRASLNIFNPRKDKTLTLQHRLEF